MTHMFTDATSSLPIYSVRAFSVKRHHYPFIPFGRLVMERHHYPLIPWILPLRKIPAGAIRKMLYSVICVMSPTGIELITFSTHVNYSNH